VAKAEIAYPHEYEEAIAIQKQLMELEEKYGVKIAK